MRLVLLFIFISFSVLGNEMYYAKVLKTAENVKLYPPMKSQHVVAEVDDFISFGTRIKTEDSEIELEIIPTGSSIIIHPNSEVVLAQDSTQVTRVDIKKGIVTCNVNPLKVGESFYVTTKNSVVSVIGAIFSVSYTKKYTKVYVKNRQVKFAKLTARTMLFSGDDLIVHLNDLINTTGKVVKEKLVLKHGKTMKEQSDKDFVASVAEEEEEINLFEEEVRTYQERYNNSFFMGPIAQLDIVNGLSFSPKVTWRPEVIDIAQWLYVYALFDTFGGVKDNNSRVFVLDAGVSFNLDFNAFEIFTSVYKEWWAGAVDLGTKVGVGGLYRIKRKKIIFEISNSQVDGYTNTQVFVGMSFKIPGID